MKYIDLMNSFDRWLEGHYLPASSQLLWYRLVALCNRCGWTEWVQVDNLRLMAELQMKREASFIEARNKLIEAGLIEHQKGKKGSPNRYKICTTVFTFTGEVQNGVNTVVESEVQNGVNTVVQTADINRQDKIKTRQKKKDISNDISKENEAFVKRTGFEEFWRVYPKKQGKGAAEQVWEKINPGEGLTRDILSAIQQAKGCEQWNRESGRYIPNPSTWLSQKRWEDEYSQGMSLTNCGDMDAMEKLERLMIYGEEAKG